MTDKKIRNTIQDQNVTIVKKPTTNIYGKIIYYILGTVMSLVFIFPLVYMIACTTKTDDLLAQQTANSPWMLFVPHFSNPMDMFNNYKFLFEQSNIIRYSLNSLLYAAISIVLNIVINGLAAYAISKLKFPGKKFFNFIIMFLIVVPVETTIVPLFLICKQLLGLTAQLSIVSIILPQIISIFNIFLFIQFFSSIPKEFEEAARMDGANTIQVFFKVILPLSKPIIATVAVFCFIGVWNDYLWPTTVLTAEFDSLYPIQAAIETIKSINGIETGQVMAALLLTSIPIFVVYIVAQKYIVKGFGAGGLKL